MDDPVAVEVLSGGMSGRLFTEVREKRALCYSVWAGYSSLKDQGSILGYAGTSNDRAQATLECLIHELYRPEVALLPIGDLFTMSPREAAYACGLLKAETVIPMHWGTFPPLVGRPGELQKLVADMGVEVVEMAGLEGISSSHRRELNRIAKNEKRWKIWQATHFKTCTHPAVVGTSEHMLLVARKTSNTTQTIPDKSLFFNAEKSAGVKSTSSLVFKGINL